MAGFCLTEFAQPPYRRLPWHEHRDASICFVVSGAYAERMRARDQECPPHSMVFKPAGERHADEFGREGGTCLLIEVGIHPAHLARTFRARYGRSIGDYVRRLRIERAAGELSDSSAAIAEIGLRAGFFDQSHLSRVFRDYTGQTPAAFRAAARAHSRTKTQRPS
jgi:methylphosphotriester-DNA--protein-cysteine methyltransferase